MSVATRIQEQIRTAISLPTATPVEIAIARPQEPVLFGGTDFEGEKTNHLTEKEVGRKEGFGGRVSIINTGGVMVAGVFVEKFLRRRFRDPFRAATALFPSGAASIDDSRDRPIIPNAVGTTDAGRLLTNAQFAAFIAKLSINADEQFVLVLRNDTGGPLVGETVADYDLGVFEGNLGTANAI